MTWPESGMHIPYRLLAPLTALCALIAILPQSGLWLPREWGYVAKPLTTLLIIGYAMQRGQATPQLRRWVLAGLWFSLVGDIALMWPKEGFLPGLVAFLIAHLCYLWAFTRLQGLAAWPWPFVFYALLAGGILSGLWSGVPEALRVPVLAYVLCLSAMGAQAAVVGWRARGTAEARRHAVLALGGLLFVISDALLATNKFAGPLPLASVWVLSTYWTAQWCIASALARSRPAS
ncbi:MAG: lysoplasmalogenase [Burkholderiaceae bacterium]|nr:lysoplasmalogenase [Burkholderiaceae bacterium]